MHRESSVLFSAQRNMKSSAQPTRGYVDAIVSAATFGTIPLFSLPVLSAGMPPSSLLVYRFGFACLFMLAVLIANKKSLRIGYGEGLRLAFLALLYACSAVCIISGYRYLPSGVATTLVFSYPVFTALIEIIFCHQPLRAVTATALLLAIVGVALLSGATTGAMHTGAIVGVVLELLSGLFYAIYMVLYPRMHLAHLGNLKPNVLIFFMVMLLLTLYSTFTTGGLYPIHQPTILLHLLLLGLVPTAISNVTLVMALKRINSTTVATLGAFEPLTAMLIGIFVFGESLTWSVMSGFVLVILAVYILIKYK